MDYYEILGVGPGATQEEIERSYRVKVKSIHPDQYPPAERPVYEAKMKELNAAYDVLKDPEKRAFYRQRQSSEDSYGGYPGGYWPGGFPSRGRVVIATLNGNGCLISMGLLLLSLILFKFWGILIWLILNYLLFTKKRGI